MLALNIQNVHKTYGNGTCALNGVSLTATPGEGIVLLGSNGSGKSTLLRCIVGLEKVSAGSICLGDCDVVSTSSSQLRLLRQRVGMVFQRFNLVGNLSAFHNVLQGALGRCGIGSWLPATAARADRQLAMYCLERVGLAEFARQRADTLSGGQQQRVAIARMLMQQPELVLLDEPVASLDPKVGRDVMDLLWDIVREQRLTVICTLHQVDLALEYADRIVGLQKGKMLLDQRAIDLSPEALNWLYQAPQDSSPISGPSPSLTG